MQSVGSTVAEALQLRAPIPLCVGFSGGLDSTVLLHALATRPQLRESGLRAWHVHHGLHEHADRWAEHCTAFCSTLSVPLTLSRVAVSRSAGQGLEAAARHARHAVFAEGLADGEVLVFAHHLDDQAETFLLRALRASGPDGLGAMRAWRKFGRGHLWRPLLGLPRASLEAYTAEHDLRWIDDPSNVDVSFDRNFLRQRVLPLLCERWPHAAASLARSAELSREAAELLDADDVGALGDLAAPGDAGDGSGGWGPALLSRSRLSALAPPRRARVLRRWIAELGLPPLPAEGIAQIESTLLTARADASATFEWHGAVIHAWRDLLHAGSVQAPLPEGWQEPWDGTAPLALPGGGILSLHALVPQGDFLRGVGAASAANQNRSTDAVAGSPASPSNQRRSRGVSHVGDHVQVAAEAAPTKAPRVPNGFGRNLLVHTRRGGERITLPGRRHSHALKQVLQDLAVPPWERARLPLLSTAEGELLAAGDRVCSAEFDRWLREHNARLHWHSSAQDVPVD